MKIFFSLVNFVVGVVSVLIGLGNLLLLANNPTGAVAGVVATVVGVTFVWLSTAAIFSNPN